jgi:hypothetical protein
VQKYIHENSNAIANQYEVILIAAYYIIYRYSNQLDKFFSCTMLLDEKLNISLSTNIVTPEKSLKTLYYKLFHPHLLYCLPLYSCTSAKNTKKLYTMQKNVLDMSVMLIITNILHPYSKPLVFSL